MPRTASDDQVDIRRPVPLPAEVDVLVVGAGPSGLTLAALLQRAGMSHAIVDRNAGVREGSRAVGVQPGTLEALGALADPIVGRGLHGAGFRAYSRDDVLLDIAYGGLPTAYPYLVLLPQADTEHLLLDALEEAGGVVHRSHRLVAAIDAGDAIEAVVVGPDGAPRIVRARFVVGADGAHSRVRSIAGIEFEGEDRPGAFALADVRMRTWPGEPHVAFVLSEEGLLVASPMAGGLVRIVSNAPRGLDAIDAAAVQALLDSRGTTSLPLEIEEVVQSSLYRVSDRLTTAFTRGRFVLTGDAAHVHSPAGGQGMNTGIQDSVALATRLRTAIAGGSWSEELAAYEAERRPIAAAVIALTGRISELALLGASPLAGVRDGLLRAANGMPIAVDRLARRMAELQP